MIHGEVGFGEEEAASRRTTGLWRVDGVEAQRHRPSRRRRNGAVRAGTVVAFLAVGALGAMYACDSRRDGAPAASSTTAAESNGPTLWLPASIVPSVPGFVSTIRGLVEGATGLQADGQPVELEPGGAFTVYVAQGATHVRLIASNEQGASTEASVVVTDTPAPATYSATAAVHVRAADWADATVRQSVLDMIAAKRIGAVQLDVKDEAGEIGFVSQVPFAATIGASRDHYDPASTIAELHSLGVRVIGRVVCFLDPVAAQWAWTNGRSDMVVLDGAGTAPLANDYGTAAFTNVANTDIRQYLIDVAKEAVALGFDEILYDYVRRPEGDPTTMQFPGLDSAPEVAVARFVADTNTALASTGAALGISVFGIAATRPEAVGQDIRLLAPHVDYVAPMVYPSHWGPGEYGVADPLRQPAEIVAASVADFHRVVAGSGAAVVPWLQDFDAGDVSYGPAEVAAQIDAARRVGSGGFLLWNSASTYHADGLPPLP
jgi:hypothetical protein